MARLSDATDTACHLRVSPATTGSRKAYRLGAQVLLRLYTAPESVFRGFVGNRRDAAGRITSCVWFVQQTLTRRDSCTYDARNRLVRWESLHLPHLGTFIPECRFWDGEGWDEYGVEVSVPIRRVSTFRYDADGRVIQWVLQRFNARNSAAPESSSVFGPPETWTYRYRYDANGRVSVIDCEAENGDGSGRPETDALNHHTYEVTYKTY